MSEEKKSEEIEFNPKSIKLNSKHFIALLAIISLAFFYVFFGFLGVRLIVGVFFLYFIPFYFILGRFSLSLGERVIFSIFMGLVVVPTLVFYLGTLLGSLRLGITTAFILLIAITLVLRWKDIAKVINNLKK